MKQERNKKKAVVDVSRNQRPELSSRKRRSIMGIRRLRGENERERKKGETRQNKAGYSAQDAPNMHTFHLRK